MHRNTAIGALTSLGLALMLGACATSRPSAMLVEAREAYDEARTGPANKYAPDLVYEARTSLEAAERAHTRDPGSDREEHLAYLAHRRVLMAMAAADERVAHEDVIEARSAFETVLVTQRDQAMGGLQESRSSLRQEREARQKAEQDARRAKASLDGLAKVNSEARRVVVTLSGEVLFKPNEATLLFVAQTRLDRVAEAVKSQGEDKTIVVAAHTDTRGGDAVNQRLSQRRAEAVRNYLVSRGVPMDKITAVGKGEVEPIAGNETAEGRANNRRVEIIIDAASTHKGPTPPR